MAFRQTLLPVPVAPAISRWGIRARLVTTGKPRISLPRARVSLDLETGKFLGGQDIFQSHGLPLAVGDFDADHRLARQRGDDPDADGPHGHGQIIGQTGDPADLDARGRFEFIHGDDRAGRDLR